MRSVLSSPPAPDLDNTLYSQAGIQSKIKTSYIWVLWSNRQKCLIWVATTGAKTNPSLSQQKVPKGGGRDIKLR
jgi:hypothetical protein